MFDDEQNPMRNFRNVDMMENFNDMRQVTERADTKQNNAKLEDLSRNIKNLEKQLESISEIKKQSGHYTFLEDWLAKWKQEFNIQQDIKYDLFEKRCNTSSQETYLKWKKKGFNYNEAKEKWWVKWARMENEKKENENIGCRSCSLTKEQMLRGHVCTNDEYKIVQEKLASNIFDEKVIASSGLVLDYLLNASTNLMDKQVAPIITRMTLNVLDRILTKRRKLRGAEEILVVGGEVGGGIMVSQCAATASSTHTNVYNNCDFAYMRKNKKKTGTKQQLESLAKITKRTPESTELYAVWLDEVNSTGNELLKNVNLLKSDYNITVIAAIFIVDRSADRTNISPSARKMADKALANVNCTAFYDLQPIHEIIKHNTKMKMVFDDYDTESMGDKLLASPL